jgi:triphosphatase
MSGAMSGEECELKMRVQPDVLARLRRHPLIGRYRTGRAKTRFQRSVYFDTPELALYRQGIVLRIRNLGQLHVQTVKGPGRRVAGLFQRPEWEARVVGDLPELLPLMDGEFAAAFSVPGLAGALRPVFSTEVKRTTINLAHEDWEIELALDEGLIVPMSDDVGLAVPIHEIELELRRGTPARLFALGRDFQEGLPVRVQIASKSDRGFEMASGANVKACKAAPVVLTPDLDAGGAFRLIAQSCVEHFLTNQDALIDARLPESIHQLRVALRRFRSALLLFKRFAQTRESARIKHEIRWLLAGLGPARDVDVFLAEILDGAPKRLAAPGTAALRAHFERDRTTTYDVALERFRDPRCGALVLAIGAWLEEGDWQSRNRAPTESPVIDFAARELERRYVRLRKDGHRLEKLPIEQRHLFRIEVKRMRYACEFFEALFDSRRTKKMIAQLAAIQDALGGLNDIAVAREKLQDAVAAHDDSEIAWSAGLIAGFHLARTKDLLADAIKAWRTFCALDKFWET